MSRTSPESSTLKPCPFCGCADLAMADTGASWVVCKSCEAEGPPECSDEDATRLWNRRFDFAQTPDQGCGTPGCTDPNCTYGRDDDWPPVKMALWRVLMDEKLNDGHYIKAFELIDKLYAAAVAASFVLPEPVSPDTSTDCEGK